MSLASDVVHDRHSENGVVKVHRREERTLFSAEKAALAYSEHQSFLTKYHAICYHFLKLRDESMLRIQIFQPEVLGKF